MIQLTKGTNVLDINLSDFSGAGQDVVQNGSFNDIGSDLILNGDFAEIGSELITNGDFSAVPLSSELLPEGASPMTGSWGSNGTIIDGKLKKTASGIAYRSIGETNGKLYKVIVDVASLDGATNFWLAGTNSANLVVGINTISIFAGSTSGYGAGINNGYSSGEGSVINSISVKEQINLVTNSNFTDTGSDVVINGTFATDTNWSKNSNWTISGGEAISDGTSSATINQSSILTEGVSYKISFEITEYTSGSGYSVRAGAGTTYSTAVTSLGVHTFYQVATGNPLYGNTIYIKASGDTIGKITNVTAEPLGEDWTLGTGWSIEENKASSIQTTSSNYLEQTIGTLVNSKNYKITFDLDIISATTTTIGISNAGAFGQLDSSDRFYTTSGTKTIYACLLYTSPSPRD